MNENPVYEVHKISDGIWAIEEGHVRCFLVTGADKAMLIDTGFGKGDLLSVVKGLTDLPLVNVITHSDRDHVGGLGQFEAAYMHPAEFDNYESGAKGDTEIALMPAWEGDVFDLGGVKLEVVLIPGHTPGSIALYDRERNIIFTGDTVAVVPIFMFGKGRNFAAYICSIEKLMRITDDKTLFLSSHGPYEHSKELLPYLLHGAKDVMAGKVKGQKPERDLPCLLYDCGKVKFYH